MRAKIAQPTAKTLVTQLELIGHNMSTTAENSNAGNSFTTVTACKLLVRQIRINRQFHHIEQV